MTEQHPDPQQQPTQRLIETRLMPGPQVGMDVEVAPTGHLILSLDPARVLGLAIVVDVEGLDGIPEGVSFAHNTMTLDNVDRKVFCRFLSTALAQEAEGFAE